jgi:Fur family zinc uptake transcriptional regulator
VRAGKGAAHAANILDALVAAARPLSAYEILDRLRPTGITAPLTVYRALEKLMMAGSVHRIASLNAFVACAGADDHGHDHGGDQQSVGFAICDECGSVAEFVDPALQDRIEADLARKASKTRASAIEVHGLCADCNNEP